MLSGGVVGRVQSIQGVDEAASTNSVPGSVSGGGYSSSDSTSSDGGVVGGSLSDAGGGDLHASTAPGHRQIPTVGGGEGAPAVAAAAAAPSGDAAPTRSARPIRTFRAERVQGRSWSLEGREVIARGAGGEEIPGAAAGGSSDFDGRRGRGGRRGRRGRR